MPAPNGHPQPSDLPLTLLTLGGAGLISPSTSDSDRVLLGPGKPLALLVYLACAPRRTAFRDHLVDLLWADVDPEKGRHALRQTIWYIKRQVGESLLTTVDGRIELARHIPCDRDLLLAATDAGDPEGVVHAYRGEFLPSFAVPGGSEFERWADVERLRLRAHFLQAAEELTHRHLASARFKEAIALARRARDESPLDERPWRLLFEALAASGDQLRFNAEVEAFERAMAADEREPDAATRARMRWPDANPRPRAGQTEPPATLSAELVGRQREFNALLRAWESAKQGPARHLHLSAPAGLGKTRLILEAQRRIRAGGTRTAYVRSNPGGRSLGFAYASDVAHAIAALPGAKGVPNATAAALVALDPSLSAVFAAAPDTAQGDEALRHRILALTDLIATVADDAPLALFLDDLHWADETSRRLLAGIIDRIDGARVLIVTAARPGAEVAELRQRGESLELLPLVAPQVGELIASLGPTPTAEWTEQFAGRVWQASGGSPLLALEALQLALDDGALRLDGEGWHCDAPDRLVAAFPDGGALRRRHEALPRLERWLLLLLAAEGSPIRSDELLALSGHPLDQAEAALLTLEQRGIIHRVAGDVEPAHDEYARLAIETAESGAEAAAHRTLARRTGVEDVRRQIRHLRAANDTDALRDRFIAYVRIRRTQRDRRASLVLAHELLGAEASEGEARALAGALPWHSRVWGSTRARVASVALLLLVGAAAGRSLLPAPPRASGPELASVELRADGRGVAVVPLGAGPLTAQHDIIDLHQPTDTQWIPIPAAGLNGVPRLNAMGWASMHLDYPDRGGVDVVVVGPDGSIRRLTDDPQDQNAAEWSPDGRLIIGTSGANSPPGTTDYDIFALDPATGGIRYLTRGRAHDQGPMVSPDGTRLAFIRMSLDTLGAKQFCISWFDGSEAACREIEGGEPTGALGWLDREQVLLTTLTTGGPLLGILQVRDLRFTALRAIGAGGAYLSPDRRWVLCRCRAESGNTWQVMEVADPAHLIDIRGSGRLIPERLTWVASDGTDTVWVERLRISAPRSLQQGESGRFESEAFNARGEPIGGITVRWSSRDTSVVRIDARTGVASGGRPGTTWIVASAGGWRADSTPVTVGGAPDVTVTRERWAPGWESRWRRGGDPWPREVRFDGAPVLHLNGDGSFASGVEQWPGWQGPSFGAEFATRLKVTRVNWQRFSVGIDVGIDSATVARWDHRNGTALRSLDGSCAAAYGGESLFWQSHLGATGGREVGTPSIDPSLGEGRSWHRVRVQVFPDGGCGVAIDGRPVWISTAKLVRRGPPIVFAYGMSYQTDLLIQEIETWEGIRGGVDWTKAPTTMDLRDTTR